VALAATCLVVGPLLASDVEHPNIVFILADDLGWRDLGCMGSQSYRTPNIDALRKRGMLFTRAYSANPLCSPTRASILTGQYPARIGFTSASGHEPNATLKASIAKKSPPWMPASAIASANRLDTSYVTYAERLKQAGYATGHFGKWHVGAEPYDALHQGFDVDIPHTSAPSPGPDGYLAPWRVWPGHGQPGEHLEDRMAAEAAKFIGEHKSGPFLLNYWAFSVHAPFQAKPELIEKYRGKIPHDSPQQSPTMAAMVETLDDAVGTLVSTLEANGLLDHTVIIFTSDNGGNMYDRIDGTTPTNNAPLRGGKGTIFDGGVRVPLIVSWPGKVGPDSSSDSPVSSVDLYPTLLAIAGLTPAPEPPCDGTSIVPILEDPNRSVRDEIFCYFPHNVVATENYSAASLQKGHLKLIRFFSRGPSQSDKLELYDVGKDPGETNDLSASSPEKARELNAVLSGYLDRTEAIIPPPNPDFDPSAPPFPKAKK